MTPVPEPDETGVSFEPVPLVGSTRAQAAEDIARWVGSPALAAVVEAFGGALPAGDVATRLGWLDGFSQQWDFRSGRERDQTVEDEIDAGPAAPLILAAADALGLVGASTPTQRACDHLLILGGLVRACFSRPLHAARLIADGAVETGAVTALGGYRPLSDRERELAATIGEAQLGADELDAMETGVRQAFGLGEPETERGERSEVVGASWCVKEHRGAGGLRVNVIAAPSSEPGTRRANTPDTYAWFAANVAGLQPGQRLLIVTTDIYVPFQHAAAVRMMALPYGVEIDTVGAPAGALRPQLAQPFSAHHYLQELRSTIHALRDLNAAL